MAPFEHAGDEPRLEDLLADPVTHLLMRYDGLTTTDVLQAVECARHRLAPRPHLASRRLAPQSVMTWFDPPGRGA